MVVGGCGGDSHDEQVRWRLTGQPNGTAVELPAEFGGSSCSEFERWTVEESGSTVEVRAFAKFSDAPDCTADQVFEPHTVRLADPLGDRRLAGCDPDNADAACTEVVEP